MVAWRTCLRFQAEGSKDQVIGGASRGHCHPLNQRPGAADVNVLEGTNPSTARQSQRAEIAMERMMVRLAT